MQSVVNRGKHDNLSGVRRFAWRTAAVTLASVLLAQSAPLSAKQEITLPAAKQQTVPPEPARVESLAAAQPLVQQPDARIEAYEHYIQQKIAAGELPGLAVAIVENGRLTLVKGYGRRNIHDNSPVDDRTVFRIASLSKGFAAGLAGLMVKEKRLDWSMQVRQVLPNINLGPRRANVTIADLLSHRVGLPPNAYDDLLEAGVSTQEILRRLAKVPLACAPGSCYGYQNVAFNLIASALEARTGASYAELMQKRIFKPLYMHRASIGLEGLQRDDNWAHPYVRTGSGWREVPVKEAYYAVPAAAGVNASIRDMAKWLMAQMGMASYAYPQDVLETLHTPRVFTPKELYRGRARIDGLQTAKYGYGWRTYDINGVQVVWHAGSVQGYAAQIAFVPSQKTGIVLLSNGYSQAFPTLLPAFLDLFVDGVKAKGLALKYTPQPEVAASEAAPMIHRTSGVAAR